MIKTQQQKGYLTSNNSNAYGGSFKVPPLDIALKAMHGGATLQRFYNKFPVYRMRTDRPDVHDDI